MLASFCGALAFGPRLFAVEAKTGKTKLRVDTPAPTKPPLQAIGLTQLPSGQNGLDLFLLLGQSNMKGRGLMPDEPNRDARIVMMHLVDPELPFLACTIGEMTAEDGPGRKGDINRILLSLTGKVPRTACVDARDLKANIGDNVHFDTAAQNEIGRRFAEKYHVMTGIV